MKALFTILLLCIGYMHGLAQIQTFHEEDGRMKLFYGDTVAIQSDSAYVIGKVQAHLLNEKLLALQDAQLHNQQLQSGHKALYSRIPKIEEQVKRLMTLLLLDNQLMSSQLTLLMSDLDRSIAIIQQSNKELESTNKSLKEELAHLDLTVKHLRKENRRMMWKQTKAKIGIGVVSLAVGVLIGVGL